MKSNVSETEYDTLEINAAFQQHVFLFSQAIPVADIEIYSQGRQTITDTDGYQLGVDYQLTEKLSFSVLAGKSETETEYPLVGT